MRKVSIVVPCYNKERYIGAMLQSVIAQTWNNIELILVNDGSTDGTRDVIEEFVPKIMARGYEYKIIDQENKGPAGAVKEGLRHISGEYCCFVDSDDEILPEYISQRAEFLDTHQDYQWAACDIGFCEDPESGVISPCREFFPVTPDGRLTENFILYRMDTSVSHYLIRTEYLRQCKVEERFCKTREVSQEAPLILPLAEGGGKIKCFPQVMYKYNRYAAEQSNADTREEIFRYAEALESLYHKTVEALDVTDVRREYLHGLCDIFGVKFLEMLALDDKDILAQAAERMCALAKRQLSAHSGINPERLLQAGLPVFIHAIEYIALGLRNPCLDKLPTAKRIIGYGALGQIARRLLPAFEGTPIKPELLWDKAGPCVAVTGQAVEPPDLESLGPDDLILLFPRRTDIVAEIMPIFESKGCQVLRYFEIFDALSAVYFGDLIETARFLPGSGT